MTRRLPHVLLLLFVAGVVCAAETQEGPPAEPGAFRSPDLVELTALDPTIHLDVRYASANNIFKRPMYTQARAFLQRPAAEALVRVHQALRKDGYGLLVFDGYRPWAVTKIFWDLTPPAKRTFVADPGKGSKHNRGCAVDLSLYSLATGKEVPMPSAYDEMSERAYPTYAGGGKAARDQRDLLREAMEREGFFVFPYEWWHFDYKDWRAYPILDIPFERIGSVTGKSAEAPSQVDLAAARMVDLTHAFDGKTLYWPTSTLTFQLQQVSQGPTPGGWFYAANNFCAPEHGGTHLDAPFHFAEGAPTAEQIPLRQLLAPAVVLDVSEQAGRDPDYRLTAEDVRRWEGAHGRIPAGAIVLLRTGWGKRWPDRKRYFGDDTPGDASHLHFPSYGKEAAELLVRERKIGVLGVDTPSIDHGPSTDFIVHRVAAAADVPGFENLAALEEVPETGAWVLALPMKIAGGSGAPLRVVALIPHRGPDLVGE